MSNNIDQTNIEISFDINSIKLIKYNFFYDPKKFKPTKDTIYGFKVNVKNSINTKKKFFNSVVYIGVFPNTTSEIICEIIVNFQFTIENFSDISQIIEDKVIEIPDVVFSTLNGIAISTCRGILLSKNAGTYLQDVYLPIINPADLEKIEKFD